MKCFPPSALSREIPLYQISGRGRGNEYQKRPWLSTSVFRNAEKSNYEPGKAAVIVSTQSSYNNGN